MTLRDLSLTERVAYEAGQAAAEARRWRVDAVINERETGKPGLAREYQRQHEAEAAAHWRRLAALKTHNPALEGA